MRHRRQYVGRFAPSPTGDLHFGSLVAASASYLQARYYSGTWLVRVEDLDPPREIPGSADRILSDLADLGLESDAPVLYQSQRLPAYAEALQRLLGSGAAFYCACSRSQLKDHAVYPGWCRQSGHGDRSSDNGFNSARLLTRGITVMFRDGLQGSITQTFDKDGGDFVIRRGDGLTAYQLAVVVDDAWQGITQVVRGSDLLDSTPRQILVFRRLGLPEPAYLHLPAIVDEDGRKLSKREHDDPIRNLDPADLIRRVLQYLRHPPPVDIRSAEGLWSWAEQHWQPDRLPRTRQIPLTVPGR